MIRKASYEDIDRVAEIYDEIHTQEERGLCTTGWIRGVYPTRQTDASYGFDEAGEVPCEFNGIPDVMLVCLEKKLNISRIGG